MSWHLEFALLPITLAARVLSFSVPRRGGAIQMRSQPLVFDPNQGELAYAAYRP